jgi:hypothetical protein
MNYVKAAAIRDHAKRMNNQRPTQAIQRTINALLRTPYTKESFKTAAVSLGLCNEFQIVPVAA